MANEQTTKVGLVKGPIKSILESDLYKFSMQWAVLKLYPTAFAEYTFINRRLSNRFTPRAVRAIQADIKAMAELCLASKERIWFESICRFLPPAYFEYLHNYRFDPSEVNVHLVNRPFNDPHCMNLMEPVPEDGTGELEIDIKGPWHRTILWEVPLMAIISENYFKYIDQKWVDDENEQVEKLKQKGHTLHMAHCNFADFGTRRRRSYESQDRVVRRLAGKWKGIPAFPNFVGTSNVHLAMKYGTKPIGTMAHEWVQAHQVLGGIRHCNKDALKAWMDVYQGELGTALTDTIGTDIFYEDFDQVLSRLYDGVRHDSGDPLVFVDKTVAHYKKQRIDPLSKTIIFSDGLDPEAAVKIAEYCKGKIKFSFGIGTNLTNDYAGSNPLNIVIKLAKINGVPVVKLSDVPTKVIGDIDAVRVVKWIVNKKPLDEA